MTYQIRSAAAIHDISGVGKCSLTVALPVLSVCGVETSVLPTAVLSTHTGGFEGFYLPGTNGGPLPMARHWKQVGCEFGALLQWVSWKCGTDRYRRVRRFFKCFRIRRRWFCGILLWGITESFTGPTPPKWRTEWPDSAGLRTWWCRNLTEASHLLGVPYREGPYSLRICGGCAEETV